MSSRELGHRRRSRRPAEEGLEPVAAVVHRIAVLLAAGVAPRSCWVYLADQPDGPATTMLAAVAASESDVPGAILATLPRVPTGHADAWRGLAAAWTVATEAGAPLAPTLHDFAASLRSLAQVQRELRSALAAPVATARLVMVLPLVAMAFGLMLGFDTVGTLFATGPGLVCLGAGAGLMLLARAWNARLLRAARPPDLTPGLVLDLTAIGVSGGASIPRARHTVQQAVDTAGVIVGDADEIIADVLELSRRAGVPAATLLRAEADEARRIARSEGDRRASTLAVTLMLPLGVCVLPAFMLLGVAPLVISVISSTVASF